MDATTDMADRYQPGTGAPLHSPAVARALRAIRRHIEAACDAMTLAEEESYRYACWGRRERNPLRRIA